MALIDVVKYNGSQDVFAWKFPNEELSTQTQLIVNDSQSAVIFKDGRACDVFGSGRYTLTTNNIPLLNALVKLPFGNESPFKAEVWFVNQAHTLDIKWGTASPVQIQDPKYGIMVPVSSYGQFGITVNDPKQFLIKLVGTLPSFGRTDVNNYFRGVYTTHVKDEISKYLFNNKLSVLELGASLSELSDFMKERMYETFNEYGLELLNFYVEDISLPKDDESVIRLKDALSRKAEMDIVGYDYDKERSYDALVGLSQNEGSAGAMVGTGVGLGVGATIGQKFGEAIDTNTGFTESTKTKACPSCNAAVKEGQKFCHECGSSLKVTCKQCNTELSSSDQFCPECGTKVNG